MTCGCFYVTDRHECDEENRPMERTRLTLGLVKTLLTTVRPGLGEVLKEVRTVSDLQREVAGYVAAQSAIETLEVLALEPAKLYEVRLRHVGQDVIGVIKAVRAITPLNLWEAKNLTDQVRDGLSKILLPRVNYEICKNVYKGFSAVGAALSFTEVA